MRHRRCRVILAFSRLTSRLI